MKALGPNSEIVKTDTGSCVGNVLLGRYFDIPIRQTMQRKKIPHLSSPWLFLFPFQFVWTGMCDFTCFNCYTFLFPLVCLHLANQLEE